MPCNDKKWVLVPNWYDKTLLRNLLGYKISSIFGMKFSPSCRFVDFVLNGNFRGNYLICDKIEVKKDRVNITQMDETCIEEPEITGGYFIQGTGSKQIYEPEVFITDKGITLSYEYPHIEDIVEKQKTYIKNKLNEIEAKCYEDNVENIDLESFAKYFLIEDFSGNQDGIFNSIFFYKERGDDKIYLGPVWDFDLSFDNAMILYPTNEKNNFSYKFTYSNGSLQTLVSLILSNDKVLQKVKETWREITNTVFTKEIILSFLNEQIEYIYESQKLNFIKWDILNIKQFMEPVCRGSYQAEVDYLKEFVEKRFDVFGEIVKNETKESIINGTRSDWEFRFKDTKGGKLPWSYGNKRHNNGNNPLGGWRNKNNKGNN